MDKSNVPTLYLAAGFHLFKAFLEESETDPQDPNPLLQTFLNNLSFTVKNPVPQVDYKWRAPTSPPMVDLNRPEEISDKIQQNKFL